MPSATYAIGVGFDTARYGHHATFLREDRQPAAGPLEFMESSSGYRDLERQFAKLAQQHPNVHFHIRVDAAGQYAANLLVFLNQFPWPKTISVGDPLRNKRYREVHFPKRKADPTESHACARFAIVEHPDSTPPVSSELMTLREVTSRLEFEVKQSTRQVNRLHNLLGRTFPELALLQNDLVRKYLWMAAQSASRFNPQVRDLYARLRARGRRGDVALGHCMRKLLHQVFGIWSSGKAYDPAHRKEPHRASCAKLDASKPIPERNQAAGRKQGTSPARKAVTATDSIIACPEERIKSPPAAVVELPLRVEEGNGSVDFAYVRSQITLERVLRHLDYFDRLRGNALQRRGSCPIHGTKRARGRSFSVHLGKGVFQCFHPPCGAAGNVLDLWCAVHSLTPYEGARHLAETFDLKLYPEQKEKRNP